ncbi:hypothetical protein SLE2022_083310 [Rubroshorea leprosula]
MDITSPSKPSSSNKRFQSGAEDESHASALTQSNESKSNLPETAHPWNKESRSVSGFGNQKTLKLLECIKLKNSVSSLISFQYLTALEVSRCHELENLVTPSIANSMVQLKRMSITDCKKIEEIIAREGEEVEKEIVFSQLKSLRFQWLPSLRSFCLSKYSFNFPSLVELIVKECPKLEVFSHGKIDTPNLRKVCRTGEDKGYWTDDLNTTIKMLYAGKREGLEELGSLRWSLANLWGPLIW